MSDPMNADALADAIRKLTTPAAEPPPPDPEALVAEGDVAGALRALEQKLTMDQAKTVGAASAMFASNARALAATQIPDFSVWESEIVETFKARGLDPATTFTSVEQWKEASDFVRGRNVEKLLKEQEERLRAEMAATPPTYAGTSTAPALPEDIDPAYATPQAVKYAGDMRVGLKSYVDNAKKLEAYDQKDGSIMRAPLIDRDDEQRDEFGDVVIQPGQF